MNSGRLKQKLQAGENFIYPSNGTINHSWKLCSQYCVWDSLKEWKAPEIDWFFSSLLIILLYWCQSLCLLPFHRFLTEPCGTQSSSELDSGPTNLSVNPKLQDTDVSEAVQFFSSRLGFIFHNEIFKGSFVKTSSCILLKMGEQIVLFVPQSSPWVSALPERFAWSWSSKYYSQGMKLPSDSRKSLTHCASNLENVSACLKWLFLR